MANYPGQELPYGHFGNPIYEPDERTWIFSRSFHHRSYTRSFSGPEILFDAQNAVHNSAAPFTRALHNAQRYGKQTRDFVHENPEFQTATELLPDLLRHSENLTDALSEYDPSRGSLLAFGSIPSERQHVPFLVSAFTSGVGSQKLWLVERQLERRGWDDTRYAWIDVPNFGRQRTSWVSESGIIQQICFSQSFDRGGTTIEDPSFMAVRCTSATTIFRPILRGKYSEDAKIPHTTIDLFPVSHVSIRETYDQTHADVAFNPWYTRQFAIISVAGDWNIWDLGSRRSRPQANADHTGEISRYRVALTADAWARVMWIRNPTTLLICTRNSLGLYDLASEERVKVAAVDIASIAAASHILNVALLPAHPSHCCVLTSTHLVMFHVQPMTGTAENGVELKMLLKLTHFWNQGDSSLNMSLSAIDEQGE
nr:hypothetical protein CFP56_62464 [Quercus suber]